MSSSAKVPVVCEYFVQNDHYLGDPYRNVFILPQKYASIKDVKLGDVIKAFPLKDAQYVLRFHYQIQMAQSSSSKKVKPVWLDAGKSLDVPCPHIQGKIIIKALRLPNNVEPKLAPKVHRLPSQTQPQRAPEPVPEKLVPQTAQKARPQGNLFDDQYMPQQQTPQPPVRQSDFFSSGGNPGPATMAGTPGGTPTGPPPMERPTGQTTPRRMAPPPRKSVGPENGMFAGATPGGPPDDLFAPAAPSGPPPQNDMPNF